MTQEKNIKGKNRLYAVITYLICSTLVAITALIGGFWGATGFRNVGIALGFGIVAIGFFSFLAVDKQF